MTDAELSQSLPVRFSAIRQFAKSPAHYLAYIKGGNDFDSRAMRIGRGVHAMVLGGKFDVFDGADRRAKGYDQFERRATSDTVLTRPEAADCERIANAVRSDATGFANLSGRTEERVDWELNGRACRSTPDCFNPETGLLSDLKSTSCSEPEQFSRHAVDMKYVNQLAFYRRALSGIAEVDKFRLVAVETSAPYCVSVINIPEEMIIQADLENMVWFDRLLECERTNKFPGYTCGGMVELVKPRSYKPTQNEEP